MSGARNQDTWMNSARDQDAGMGNRQRCEVNGSRAMTDTLIQRLSDEADLCRNDGATDVAKLLDDAVYALVNQAARLAAAEIVSAQPAAPACECAACKPNTIEAQRMILCSICGNKRCPHATDHRHACTNSNEYGQPGSVFGGIAPADAAPSVAPEPPNPWKDAVIDGLVVSWVLKDGHYTNPRQALADLIGASVMQALDPAISKQARDLVESGRAHPPRAPLTEEQLRAVYANSSKNHQTWEQFARAIEAAHGIGAAK